MRIAPLLPALVAVALAVLPVSAQGFDPAAKAMGWTRADADGSLTLYDAQGRRLVTWLRDGTNQGEVDLSGLDGPPEFWVIDSYGNAWVVVGTTLVKVDPKGKVGTRAKLPGAVADLAWDPRGLVIAYRSAEPFLEKRDYKNGNVIWSLGTKPSGPATATVQTRIAVTNNNEVLVTRGTSLGIESLDLLTGKPLRQVSPFFSGAAAPNLDLGGTDRGPLVWWSGKGVAFAAVPSGQAAFVKMNGLLLARIDLTSHALEFVPTGLTEDHTLAGVIENDAVFIKPKGGLVFVPMR